MAMIELFPQPTLCLLLTVAFLGVAISYQAARRRRAQSSNEHTSAVIRSIEEIFTDLNQIRGEHDWAMQKFVFSQRYGFFPCVWVEAALDQLN